MSSDLFGSCGNGNPCPGSCNENYSEQISTQFGNTVPSYNTNSINNISTNATKTVYGGLLNGKRVKQSASMHVLAKASLTTFNPISSFPKKSTLPQNIHTSTATQYSGGIGYTNVGGPGDIDPAAPYGTTRQSYTRGNKARVYSVPGRHNGVDVKHGSYNRYLMRKKGRALRCNNC